MGVVCMLALKFRAEGMVSEDSMICLVRIGEF